MKQFQETHHRLVKEEFDKGNKVWLVKEKKANYNGNKKIHKEIVDISWMEFNRENKLEMESICYNLDDGTIEHKKAKCLISTWNFPDYKFYILTKKEAARYLKKIMLHKLSGKKNE